ncbi:hypothetical protein C9374_002386 [Naegleria lovaniensis]|uniref:MICOS complex subunit MIC10 n=1 Tax=Naegleria lovaniensis TaxID=51637 RepID=A0AA88GTA6_NAELO|nr:uncharacterized protein C9374_002386 [Naegleria lovaniensis]KAG2386642.1 hypothetical protein C9374_002386 [Naegleria lovaniensis]
MSTSQDKVPSELLKDEKLEHCLENILQKTTIGFVASVIPAFVLLRGRRSAALGFGAGIGFGMGWTECRLLMEKNIHFNKKFIAQVEVPKNQ